MFGLGAEIMREFVALVCLCKTNVHAYFTENVPITHWQIAAYLLGLTKSKINQKRGNLMQITDEVRPGANRYISERGALKDLDSVAAPFTNPIIVTGTQSYAAFQQFYAGRLQVPVFRYDGTASDEDAARISNEAQDADLVIAIGGGRVIDTAKVVAENLGVEIISVPTLASNCAPFSAVGAIYNPDHTFKRVAYFTKTPFATIVDWDLILTTPHDYFVAGIGDTLAKWYEMAGLTKGRDAELPVYTRVGKAAAGIIRETLEASAAEALADLDNGTITRAFTDIVDCIIGVAGEVGGFAVADGRQAGAHATHNGLTFIPGTGKFLHGAKVAYGILVQLASSDEQDTIAKLLPFYRELGLPTCLADLDITDDVDAKIKTIADRAASDEEAFVLLHPGITSSDVAKAIKTVEALQ
jgi:uncharacterized oxidoreductase